jgi:hypothetical protein
MDSLALVAACETVLFGHASNIERAVSSMAAGPEFDPPEQIDLGLDEALELLSTLEDARDGLIETDHFPSWPRWSTKSRS